MTMRALTRQEIETLERQGCSAEAWGTVRVTDGFDPLRVRHTMFAGTVDIGRLDGTFPDAGDGVRRVPGIRDARLQDVRVGDGCYISGVRGGLVNLDIGAQVLIENVGLVVCVGETTFGNGHEIAVFNEGGGRELRMTDRTSAQIAYLSVMYRDQAELIKQLNHLADRCAAQRKASTASIGEGALIRNVNEIRNVRIGAYARIDGATRLLEGTVDSSKQAPSTVGTGVIAEHFIIQQGVSVTDGALVGASLVGEGSRVGKQFSCENTAMFANCEGFHSEACSWFAGPYSVTHHRSTLMIAACTSFYNAGSGTNQSNHMYKLGPLHQGIMERGSKTGSFSYLLWPSRVGAFTAVMGKHYANFDTSDFPFSYINEEGGKSTLTPGMNFFTVGTLRDGEKWPARDRRKSADKLDQLIFDVLSPYTAQKMIRGSRLLQELGDAAERSAEYVTCRGIQIKRLLLKTCRRYYALALEKYFGDVLVARFEANAGKGLREVLKPAAAGEPGTGEWLDVCGLLCRKSRLDRLVADLTAGRIASQEDLLAAFKVIHAAYREDAWNWCLASYREITGRDLAAEPAEGVKAFLEKWKQASHKLLNMVAGDAQKEFEGATRTGFGIDGNGDADFVAVRGAFETNKFVRKLKDDGNKVDQRFDAVVNRLV
ncbi:MAG: hypothetical protein A2498_01540 [Lentisphaerae bacterium RIFOXYC12_FULL_60_16]|nr:MAG: hypothetical protein A2498_01540 [Lentisphaerae bacterium RIFOXYC12_FULL_60_16]OGV75161.1 MAG: hypothetical protein A2340_05615 [Lentisphaerae bacterium RIFOXYB12_FULL_60_10]